MKQKTIVKRVIDIALTVTLLLLMAFQVTEQLAHEWLGITMFVLTIVHQALNRRFYAAVFRGKYNPLRIFQLLVNVLLLLSFVCTALSGMMMSRFATPSERHPAVVRCPSGTPCPVALVVCTDGRSPRTALRHYHRKDKKPRGKACCMPCDDGYLRLWLLSVLQGELF